MAHYLNLDHEGLQLSEDNGLYLVTSPVNHTVPYRSQPPPLASAGPENHEHHPKVRPDKRARDSGICGLRKVTFWLALALAVVVIVAAVVGGVGGSVAMKTASRSSCSLPNAAILNTASEAAKETLTQTATQTVTQTATQIVTQTATLTTTQTVTQDLTHDSVLISKQFSTQTLLQTVIQTSAQSAPSNPVVCPAQFNATGAITNLDVPAPITIHDVLLDCPNLNGKSYTAFSGSRDTFTQLCNHTWLDGSPATGYKATVKDIIAIISYTMDDCMEACSSMNQLAGATTCAGVAFKPTMSDFPGGNCWLKNATGPGTVDWFVASARIVPP